MKIGVNVILCIALLYSISSCRSAKKLQTAVNKRDTQLVVNSTANITDSFKEAAQVLDSIKKNTINFKTFSAKIKVQYEDYKTNHPDFNAFVRLYKDSVMWISINATFLNIEAFRIFITKDSIIVLNKIDKQVEYHDFNYVQNIAHIPLTFSTLQDLVIGNPLYVSDSIVAYRKTANHILLGTAGKLFKNLLTISSDSKLIERSKLDDIDITQNRTADITYANYEKRNTFNFATYREITVAEKTKVDITLQFKQYDFNNELSFPFTVPKNYKIK